MESPNGYVRPFLTVICFVFVVLQTIFGGVTTLQRPFNNSIPAAFVFGDSTVDSGNNDFIVTAFKSNFPPYGKDFPNHIATGRFTNGRLVTDFLAEYVGIKDTVPPYLDPTLGLEDLLTGVTFASAGTGFDPLTAQISSVIPIQTQIYLFREYKGKIEEAIGKEETKALINRAVFLISCGTNDLIITYFSTQFRRSRFSVSDYRNFLLQYFSNFVQSLIEEGAQVIAVVGLPPIGCLPIVINANYGDGTRNCIEKLSSVAREYNQELQEKMNSLNQKYPNSRFIYGDIYGPLDDMTKNPQKYGFSDSNHGCCGGEGFPCGPYSDVCSDASKNVFWDQVHPTEAAYYNLFMSLRPAVDNFLKEPHF